MGSELLADIEDFDYYNRDNLSELDINYKILSKEKFA